MKKQIKNYETPEVEIVEINVEKGFSNSSSELGGAGNEDSNEGDGEW